MRTILTEGSTGSLMDSPIPVATSTPPSLSDRYGMHTRKRAHTAWRDHCEAVGGSINNSLAEPSISPRRYDRPVDHLCDYT